MRISIRPIVPSDTETCGHICYEGFKAVSERHGFPPVFASVEGATRRVRTSIEDPGIFGLVAEVAGKIMGFSFLSERDPIRAVGPIVIDPAVQGHGVGRLLMEAVLERAEGAPGVRLLQDSFNMQSMSLYASLGFASKELVVAMTGRPVSAPLAGWDVRHLEEEHVSDCETLHARVHGFPRTRELRDTMATGSPVVALRDGGVRAYMAVPTFWIANHGVAATEQDMKALILGVAHIVQEPLSFLLPVRRGRLFRWCLAEGLRAIRPMTLMAKGVYHQPNGSYIPSVLY